MLQNRTAEIPDIIHRMVVFFDYCVGCFGFVPSVQMELPDAVFAGV
jgi:hypothetical protein